MFPLPFLYCFFDFFCVTVKCSVQIFQTLQVAVLPIAGKAHILVGELYTHFPCAFQRHGNMIVAQHGRTKIFTDHADTAVFHHDIGIAQLAMLGMLDRCDLRQLHHRQTAVDHGAF